MHKVDLTGKECNDFSYSLSEEKGRKMEMSNDQPTQHIQRMKL
jgi:hypothetical protein